MISMLVIPSLKPLKDTNITPSIIKPSQENFPKCSFAFYHISELDTSKSYQKENIPTKLLKDNKDICSTALTTDVSRCIINGMFPNNL